MENKTKQHSGKQMEAQNLSIYTRKSKKCYIASVETQYVIW